MLKLQVIITCDCHFDHPECQEQTWASVPVGADGKLAMDNAYVPGCADRKDWLILADGKTYCPACAGHPRTR